MGIQGLLQFVEKASRPCHLTELRGCTAGVDSYCLLHRGTFACAQQLALGEETNVHIAYCLKYVKMLQHHDIKPVMVFDGRRLPAKAGVEAKRREARQEARRMARELLRQGRKDQALVHLRRGVDVTHAMALRLIQQCRAQGVDCIVAPYEADAQLAYLSEAGLVDVVVTEDSDLVAFGCKKVLFKLDLGADGVLFEADKLHLAMNVRPEAFSMDKFRHMCILSGCDYLSSLPGIGLKKALRFVTRTANPDMQAALQHLPAYLNMRHLDVTAEYKEQFALADATFRHQLVFDPVQRRELRLSEPLDLQHCSSAGEESANASVALQLALGNLDPHDLRVVDSWCPDKAKVGCSSIWSREYRRRAQPRILNEANSRAEQRSPQAQASTAVAAGASPRTPKRPRGFPLVVDDGRRTLRSRFFARPEDKEQQDIAYDEKINKEIHDMYVIEQEAEEPLAEPADEPENQPTSPVLNRRRFNPFCKQPTKPAELTESPKQQSDAPKEDAADAAITKVVQPVVSTLGFLQQFQKPSPKRICRRPGLSRNVAASSAASKGQVKLTQMFAKKD